MMKVVDANFLRDPALSAYLEGDPRNQVVFTDYACMECYKGNAIKNIPSSLTIVSKYPDQIVVLKGTRDIIRLQSSGHPTLDDLVDIQQSAEFREFCHDVRAALDGDVALMSQLLRLGEEANSHFERMRIDAPGTAEAIKEMAQSFSTDQLAALRRRDTLSKETCEIIESNILSLAALFFQAHPDVSKLPKPHELRDSFIFRYALAAQLLVIWWLTSGGIESVNLDRLRNDVVDMTHVAYATMFDGILSKDRKLVDIYEEAKFVLQNLFV